jgi:hypothetical protein
MVRVSDVMPPMVCSALICGNTRMSQMICRSNSTSSTGRMNGNVMNRKRCHGLDPSSSAASITSPGTWVSPAKVVKATNGTDCHVMMTVATKKKLIGSMSQLCWSNGRPNTVDST